MAVTLQDILGCKATLDLAAKVYGQPIISKRRAMTESEWLSCQDPMKMLAAGKKAAWPVPSDRKQVLFAAALLGWDESLIESFTCLHPAPDKYKGRLSVRLAHSVPDKTESIVLDKTPAQVADILREIVGNPYQPLTLPPGPPRLRKCGCGRGRHKNRPQRHNVCAACGGEGFVSEAGPCPWLTPTVLSLAWAAYDDRPVLWECHRHGAVPESEVYQAEGGGYGHAHKTEDCWQTCSVSQNGGTLDPLRLDILADALEEAGCNNHTLLLHLRGYVRHYGPLVHERSQYLLQDDCWYYKRSDCQHYRGCWALDLVLGKS